jgi:hypothetical protein
MALAGLTLGRSAAETIAINATHKPTVDEIQDAEKLDKVLAGVMTQREKFIPIARFALVDRLTRPGAWVADDPQHARRLFQFLAHWRKQTYIEHVFRLQQAYEPFSPDSDFLVTRTFTPDEKRALQTKVFDGVAHLMESANFEALDPEKLLKVIDDETHYGLDLEVDLTMFEQLALYYSGNITKKELRRSARRLYLRKEEYVLPIFQRLCIVFKLRSEDDHVKALMTRDKIEEAQARKRVKKQRAQLPDSIRDDRIYMKLFKDIPKSDIEMIFPNTKVKFRLKDKLRLGVTTSSGIGMGLMATISKVAVAVGIFAWFGALIGLGVIIFRQIMNFINTKNKYLQTMARNLYSHALADNGGVIEMIAGRAAEQDTKEDILLYSVLVKEAVNRAHLHDVDRGIESFLGSTFGINMDFETEQSLERLMKDGLVTEAKDGTLRALPPNAAAKRVDELWDQHLDVMVADGPLEGSEIEGKEPTAAVGEKNGASPIDLI